jgi:hypothetical protein
MAKPKPDIQDIPAELEAQADAAAAPESLSSAPAETAQEAAVVTHDNEIAALLLAANPDVQGAFLDELLKHLAGRGVDSIAAIKRLQKDGVSVEYLFTSTIRNTLNDKALNIYAASRDLVALDTTAEGTFFGVPAQDIFPGSTPRLASRIRSQLGHQGMTSARDLSHRSAPPRIHQALIDAFRVGDFGFDGQFILSFISKEGE